MSTITQTSDTASLDPEFLLAQLSLLIKSPELIKDEAQRQKLSIASRRASQALETRYETIHRICFSPLPLVVSRIAQERNIFTTLVETNGPVDVTTLAQVTGLERLDLEAILDYLLTQEMVQEVRPGWFAATMITHRLAQPFARDSFIHFHDSVLPGYTALKDTLNLGNSDTTAFSIGHRTSDDYYAWAKRHPLQHDAFHRLLMELFHSLPTWLEAVDFQSEFAQGAHSTDVVLVDIGGSGGQQSIALSEFIPDLQGRVIVQDLPQVLNTVPALDGIEKMNYNFFTEQPIKDARVYYLRHIMHNYNDELCLSILSNQRKAMGRNSFLVIDEKVLSDANPHPSTPGIEHTAGINLAMKVFFNSLERRESHWRQLLARAGFHVQDIRHYSKPFDNAVIIASVMEQVVEDRMAAKL